MYKMYDDLFNIIDDILFNDDLKPIQKVHLIKCIICFFNDWCKDE